MKSNIIIGGLLFTSIILLSMFVNTREYFNSPDSVLDNINKLKYAYNLLKTSTTNISTTKINTPKGDFPLGDVIYENLVNISTLEKTYNEIINGPQSHNSENIRSTMQKSIKELSDRYNYIIKKLNLKIPEYDDIKIPIIGIKTATETAIENTKDDPILVSIQNVQDAFISLRQELMRCGRKIISTPTGNVSAQKMVEENITILNKLTDQYITMIKDKESNPKAKNFVQDNLNTLITTYNNIITGLKLKRNLLKKDMTNVKERPDSLAQIIASRPLVTQMSTHGMNIPPNPFKTQKPVSVQVIEYPKPLPEKYIYTKLSKIYHTLPTQNSMLD